ncbi:MAG: diacylglycerol kinase family protein [Saprospiraceae bacterium]|nr:diacylglycerol kinase family protein [Saprospiraceae bacterium]
MSRPTQTTWQSFKVATLGIYQFLLSDYHGKVHLSIATFTCLSGIYLGLSKIEWLIVALCIGMVFSAEMINAAIEKLCDLVQPKFDARVKVIKDISAGAVLVVSLIAGITGIAIFLPKIITLTRALTQ